MLNQNHFYLPRHTSYTNLTGVKCFPIYKLAPIVAVAPIGMAYTHGDVVLFVFCDKT